MRQNHRTISIAVIIISLIMTCQASGQKRTNRRVRDTKPAPENNTGPKRSTRTLSENERVKVITRTEYIRVPAPSNKGKLWIAAVQNAQVTLTPLKNGSQKSDPIQYKITDTNGGLFLSIPPGEYRLLIEHPDYVPVSETISINASQSKPFAANLEKAMVSLSLISEPGARVYAGNTDQGVVPVNGELKFDLPPGQHKISVNKNGYEIRNLDLMLSLNEPVHTERVDLVPIPNSAEVNWGPDVSGSETWFPKPAWNFAASGAKAGAMVRGDKVALFHTETNRQFNIYRNFEFVFDFVFSNNKGASWVVRATDPNNYYLFEIITPPGRKAVIKFWACRDGILSEKRSQPVPYKLDKPGDSYLVTFKATGNTFNIKMEIHGDTPQDLGTLAVFQDDANDALLLGGIGFRGKDSSEFLIKSVFIIPE